MIRRPSPNTGARRADRPLKLIVLHADASANELTTLHWLQNPASKVSYHVLIGRKGDAYRVVDDDRTAWHAGRSKHPACADQNSVNSESLGLSFANRHDGHEMITPEQIAMAQEVIAEWRAQYGPLITTTHAGVAPGRKTDPEHIPNFRIQDFA